MLQNGDKILITWLPPCINGRGDKNPYIGMSGIVNNYNGKTFDLFTGKSWLVGIGRCTYFDLNDTTIPNFIEKTHTPCEHSKSYSWTDTMKSMITTLVTRFSAPKESTPK